MTLEQPVVRNDIDGAKSSGPVIIAMDDTYAAGEALLWAARFSQATGQELMAVRSWHRGLGNSRPAAVRATQDHLRHELDRWCQPAHATDVTPRLAVLEGDTTNVVVELSDREKASLVVCGTEASSTGSLFDETATTRRLAARINRPLAIVPTGGAARLMREVIVAVSGSVRSLAACQWVADRAVQCGWRVHAVAIFEPYVEWVPANDPRSVWKELEGELAGPWTAALTGSRVPFTCEVIEGLDHIAALTRVARDRHADAIVVGAQGHTERRHHRRGNTGIHLVHHSHLPVILVPTRAE